jgi:hypothetical protein
MAFSARISEAEQLAHHTNAFLEVVMSQCHGFIEALEGRQLLSGSFPVSVGTPKGDTSRSVAADDVGTIYVVGSVANVGQTSSADDANANLGFVSRFNADGSLVWTRYFGGATPDKVDTDGAGNVFIAGSFSNTVDFDPRHGVNNVTSVGGTDGFVARLSAKGNLVYVKTIGGSGNDTVNGLAVGHDGEVRFGGGFVGRSNFNSDGSFRISSGGARDGYIAALDTDGTFQWAGSFGGTGSETLEDMALDPSGNVLATGRYNGVVDFDPTHGVSNNNIAPADEAFTLKWTDTGGFVFAAGFGGAGIDFATGVTSDRAGNVYTIGNFQDSGDFDPSTSTFTLTGASTGTVFVSKLNSAGTFVYAKALGGALGPGVGPGDISVDKHQNVVITGRFSGTQDFDPDAGTSNLVSDGVDDVFISKLDANGAFVFAKSFGGTGDAFPTGSVLDHDGNILVTGAYESAISFPLGGGGMATSVSNGSSDYFLNKLNSSGDQF